MKKKKPQITQITQIFYFFFVPFVYFVVKWELKGKGEYDQAIVEYTWAIDDFNRAIELDRKDAWTYYQRAFCWKEKRNYDLAIADYTSVLEIMPKHADSFKGEEMPG
jgi:tetratricopeptide (TPR) repeat protein